MPLKPLDPALEETLSPGWDITVTESGRGTNGLRAQFLLSNGTVKAAKVIDVGDDGAQQALANLFAAKAGLEASDVLSVLLPCILKVEIATRTRDAKKSPWPKDEEYEEDADGLWWLKHAPQGDERIHLANFSATILTDIVEDDGTAETKRYFELEATCRGMSGQVRVAAKDFHGMTWVADTLGPKAHVIPGPYLKDHTAAAIQDLSATIDHQHTYVHTGWRWLDQQWGYLHGGGAITAQGLREDILVRLADGLARYQLPAPPSGPALRKAIATSLALRTTAPHEAMIPLLGAVYLAPLREFLAGEPPDFTTWVAGASGQFKSEYAALVLSHFGDFTRLTLPASFVATGNGLERLCHTMKDSVLVIDDYYPVSDRRQADAMQQTVGRLLRGIGNQAARQRMRHDTSMRAELPPRCVALATGERLPDGHSTNARIFLVTLPKLSDAEKPPWAKKLSTAQKRRGYLAKAMAGYVQWLATHWEILTQQVPAQFHALRTHAYQQASHAREPGQVAYLQLGWEGFTQYAVESGAVSADTRLALLQHTQAVLLAAARDHQTALADEATVPRFLALLLDGFASKKIHLRTLQDQEPPDATLWGWTARLVYDPSKGGDILTYHTREDTLIGYLDESHIYLIPEATYAYLVTAAKTAGKVWPVDSATLLRELDDAMLIQSKRNTKQRLERTLNKKVNGQQKRCIWLKRDRLVSEAVEGDDAATAPPPVCVTCHIPYTNSAFGWYCATCQAGVALPLEPDDELPF